MITELELLGDSYNKIEDALLLIENEEAKQPLIKRQIKIQLLQCDLVEDLYSKGEYDY